MASSSPGVGLKLDLGIGLVFEALVPLEPQPTQQDHQREKKAGQAILGGAFSPVHVVLARGCAAQGCCLVTLTESLPAQRGPNILAQKLRRVGRFEQAWDLGLSEPLYQEHPALKPAD
ncbi:MAG TPA: hypothetical protein VJN64_01000 [Terriglobales bacterium]|nr:hypothetical protein [Terriglobales bacterium]